MRLPYSQVSALERVAVTCATIAVMLTDLSLASTTAAIQENLFAFARSFAVLDNAVLVDTSDLRRLIVPGVENPFFNSVFHARLDDDRIDGQIDAALAPYQQLGLSAYWWSFGLPPPVLANRLFQRGLWSIRNEGMAADLGALNETLSTPAGLRIERVADETTFRKWLELNSTIFGFSRALEAEFDKAYTRLGFAPEAPLQHYLGILDGKPVASSSGMVGGGVIGLYNVGVVFSARGRGIGSALTLHPLRLAREAGYRVGVLQATRLGYRMYRRLGFQDVIPVMMFVSSAS
jgi:GNAT superfamily N-acetyltransferase